MHLRDPGIPYSQNVCVKMRIFEMIFNFPTNFFLWNILMEIFVERFRGATFSHLNEGYGCIHVTWRFDRSQVVQFSPTNSGLLRYYTIPKMVKIQCLISLFPWGNSPCKKNRVANKKACLFRCLQGLGAFRAGQHERRSLVIVTTLGFLIF